jgi:hypothetical protein
MFAVQTYYKMKLKHTYMMIAPFYILSFGILIASYVLSYVRTYIYNIPKISILCYGSSVLDDGNTYFATVPVIGRPWWVPVPVQAVYDLKALSGLAAVILAFVILAIVLRQTKRVCTKTVSGIHNKSSRCPAVAKKTNRT